MMADNDWLPRPAARRSLYWMAPIVLLSLALITGLLYREGVWVAHEQLHFRTDSAEGLARGMAVKLHGFGIGTVSSVELDPEADTPAAVLVKLDIERRFMSLIPQGSIVTSAQEGLIGQNYLYIKPPENGADAARRSLADGEQLPFERPRALADLASDMARKVEPFVTKAGELASSLADPDGDLRQIIHQTRLASEQAPALARQASDVLQRTDQLLSTTQGSAQQINSRLPAMLAHADETLDHAAATSADIRQLTARHAAPMLDATQQTAEDAQAILSGARKSWPLRALAPPADYRSLPADVSPVVLPVPGAEARPGDAP
ncbi:MAG: MlaD family protein [Perlucidibaca sp.]